MPGDSPDPLFVEARRGLLDALVALGSHGAMAVLVGAQAIYLHTEDFVTGVALMTKDADVMLIPPIAPAPDIQASMLAAGFQSGSQPGIWLSGQRQVDLLVPDRMAASGGRRAARLEGHGERTARKVSGLEGAAIDNAPRVVRAFDVTDRRAIQVRVAGPAALLVSKAYKLHERAGESEQRRLDNKDAFDTYRLLRLPIERLMPGFRVMASDVRSADVARTGITAIAELFESASSLGSTMAGQYVQGVGDPENIRASVAALAGDLLIALRLEGLASGA